MQAIPAINARQATGETKAALDNAQSKYGFVPNLISAMANAPALAEAYMSVGGLFDQTSFNALEKLLILMTASRENDCGYCIAAHSTFAEMRGLDDTVVNAIREDHPIADRKLQALREFVTVMVRSRGWPEEADLQAFFSAGYEPRQVLEVILGIAMKTMSNYTNHVASTPVDEVFAKHAWDG